MTTELHVDRLVVLSDLHLAPPGEQCVFDAHEPLVALIEHLTQAGAGRQWLVLNGDVFDFLQIPGYDALSLPLAPQRMTALLDALANEPPQRNVVAALARYTAAGHGLSCLPGNHDAELNLASVQQVLAQHLGSSSVLPPSAGEWRLTAAGRPVWGLHGHHKDAFNAISSERMRRAQADGADRVPMPPGSRLVCQFINPFRRAATPEGRKRFPFIDRLPSEYAVLLALLVLDPRLASQRLAAALGIGAAALLRKARMATSSQAPRLAERAPATNAQAADADWTALLTAPLTAAAAQMRADNGAAFDRLDHELDAFFAGQSGQGTSAATQLAGGGSAVRQWLLNALVRELRSARKGFRSDVSDDLARSTLDMAAAHTAAITGHTHAAKQIDGMNGATYLNTGTWLAQVLPPDDLDATTVQGWLERLQHDELPTWNGQPVAIVDAQGPRLMCWNGSALVAWEDAVA